MVYKIYVEPLVSRTILLGPVEEEEVEEEEEEEEEEEVEEEEVEEEEVEEEEEEEVEEEEEEEVVVVMIKMSQDNKMWQDKKS